MNIQEFSQLYRQTVKQKSSGSATVRLKLDRVEAKKVRVLSHVTVENRTSAYTKCRLGINAGGRDHYLDELGAISANELAVSRSDIILGEGDVFFAELTETISEDEIIITCIGWENSL